MILSIRYECNINRGEPCFEQPHQAYGMIDRLLSSKYGSIQGSPNRMVSLVYIR